MGGEAEGVGRMATLEVDVDAIACGAPPSEVEESLEARPGVRDAAVHLEDGAVEIAVEDGADVDDLLQVLEFFGLEVAAVDGSGAPAAA